MDSRKRTLFEGQQPAGVSEALIVAGYQSCVIQIAPGWVGTIAFQVTLDGTNWVAVEFKNLASGGLATNTVNPGLFWIECGGLHAVRLEVTAYTSGTVNAQAAAA